MNEEKQRCGNCQRYSFCKNFYSFCKNEAKYFGWEMNKRNDTCIWDVNMYEKKVENQLIEWFVLILQKSFHRCMNIFKGWNKIEEESKDEKQ